MDWKQAIEAECEALRPIVALLLSLARLAEMAGERSAPLRAFVLWLLRRAEILAWTFVTGESDPPSLCLCEGGRDEAMLLARSFRHMAEDLSRDMDEYKALLVTSGHAGGNPAQGPQMRQRSTARFGQALSGLLNAVLRANPLPDTS